MRHGSESAMGAAVIALAMTATAAHANDNGAFAGLNGSIASRGTSCMLCHGRAVGAGSVSILGVPAAYEVDAVYNLTIRVADGDQAGAGFQLSVEDPSGEHVGELIISDPVHTRESAGPSGWLTHTQTGVEASVESWADLGNAAEYQVQWRAPASDIGPLTFFVAGNAINFNGNTEGDRIYLDSHTASADSACVSDITGDGVVDVQDLVLVILAWGTADAAADVNGDGVVDVVDLTQVILAWGAC